MTDGAFALRPSPVDRLDSLFAGLGTQQRALLRHIAAGDRSSLWSRDGCRDMAEWLSGRYGISNWTARRWVNAAHALEHLPELDRALNDGVLALDKVVELARFATPETEKKLISWARRVSPAAVRRKADLAAKQAIEEVREAERARSLQWSWFDDGRRLALSGEFPADQGAVITKAIERLADRLPDLPIHEPSLCPEVRREERYADALFAMASNTISEEADADRATVVVHTTLGQLGAAPGEIEAGPVIHPETTRRLKCDGRLRFVISDDDGNALGIGRAARNVPAWLMQQVKYRDHGCTFPGCGSRAFLHAHHIKHWEDGGPTDLNNLLAVCHFHHKLLHEFGWSVRLIGSRPQWYRPSGSRFSPGKDPPH
jgi:hypothetical protein